MTNFFSAGENYSDQLMRRIESACHGLVYISEADSPIVPFYKTKEETVPWSDKTKICAEQALDFFFARLTEERDWYGEKEKRIAKRFGELQKLLEENLRDLKVFRVGEVQIDIYVAGTDPEGNTAGIQTKAVET